MKDNTATLKEWDAHAINNPAQVGTKQFKEWNIALFWALNDLPLGNPDLASPAALEAYEYVANLRGKNDNSIN